MLQGISLGGEFTGSMVYTTEASSPLLRGLVSSSTAAGTTIGFILGLPLDIRHVTFGAANFAYGMAAMGFDVPVRLLISCTLGVAAIGLTNLLVSFSLALYTAMKSRRVRFGHGRQLFGRVIKRILSRPQDLFVPPRRSIPTDET